MADGRTVKRELVLDDEAGRQLCNLQVGEVAAVRFTIESSFGSQESKRLAVADLEFFGSPMA